MALSPNIGDREHQKFLEDANGNTAVRIAYPSNGLDAFGRQRVSNPYTVFDTKQLGSNQSDFWDISEVSGSGTSSSYDANTSSTDLDVSATTAGKIVRQTYQRFNYQPGKSQQVMMTGSYTNEDGITSICGLYDGSDGIYFSNVDGVNYMNISSSTSGSEVVTSVAQADWNIDTFSEFDPTKTQIFILDFEWLGVGIVRTGFVVGGQIIYCHEFLNANVQSLVYMKTPNLPLRYSIENDGTGGAATLQAICSSVNSEGGQEDIGLTRHISNGTTAVTATTAGTTYALLGVRQNTSFPGTILKPLAVEILITSNSEFEWELVLNPTVAGTFTYSQVSTFDSATGASTNTVTGGTPLAGGYGNASGSGGGAAGTTGGVLASSRWLGRAIDGTLDEIVLVVRGFANGDTFHGSINVRELS